MYRISELYRTQRTTSSAFILGQVSQSIEPIWSNCYVKDLAKTKVTIKNPQLKDVLAKYGRDDRETWINIRTYDGSVQQLDFLSDKEKEVFLTFEELNQADIIYQASIRQKHIDQGQSLNVMVGSNITTKELNEMYVNAWSSGIKGLYYQHSTNAAQQLSQAKLCLACEA